ncbi:MAG: BolA family protein [Marinicellaceae bacterium]
MQPQSIEELIKNHINCHLAKVESEDLTHFTAIIVSDDFLGQSKIKRHRMVYAALGDHMQSDIHALSFQSYTIEEYENLK